MAGRKKVVKENIEVQSVQQTFSKEQILVSERYCNKRDLVDALLDDKKKYTLETVDNMIEKYMKGQVK